MLKGLVAGGALGQGLQKIAAVILGDDALVQYQDDAHIPLGSDQAAEALLKAKNRLGNLISVKGILVWRRSASIRA